MDPNVLLNPRVMELQLQARQKELEAAQAKTQFEMATNAYQLAGIQPYVQPPAAPVAMMAPPPLPEARKEFPWLTCLVIACIALFAFVAGRSDQPGTDHRGRNAVYVP